MGFQFIHIYRRFLHVSIRYQFIRVSILLNNYYIIEILHILFFKSRTLINSSQDQDTEVDLNNKRVIFDEVYNIWSKY